MAADRKPNIVFLLPDQLRPDFLGCYGAGFLKTPNIDALAKQGTRWETATSPSPICVPARASMLMGQHAHANGVIDNLSWVRPDHEAIGLKGWPQYLVEAGYSTSAVGKMHFYPWDICEGFQTRIIAEDKRHIHIEDDYDAALKQAGLRKVHAREQAGYGQHKGASINDYPDHLQVDRWVADQTVAHINALPSHKPFALMVGFPGPHCPYDPPEYALAAIDPAALPQAVPPTLESRSHHPAFVASYMRAWADLDYSDLTPEESRRLRHHYAALVERLDADVGQIVEALRNAGHLDNTIIVFASDHGDYLGDFSLVGKTYFHEPSIRVPLIVADFRAEPANASTTQMASLLDLPATFLEFAGVDVPAHWHGHPLGDAPDDRIICGVTTHGFMARSDRWKLVRYKNGVEALFDLQSDPYEQVNCLAERPDMRALLDAALAEVLLEGLIAGHADKRVSEAQGESNHAFFRRGWTRTYPAPVQP
ncbi:MAG: sulfatase-like hydrolase/transferase [Hyphomicrobiales bacterium]